MTIDEKMTALGQLVREARIADRDTLAEMEAATAAWKAANKVLTERLKVFTDYQTELLNKLTIIGEEPQ